MKRSILENLLMPASRRVGSMIAGGLLALGATQGLTDQVELLIPALIAFCADLGLSKWNRR